MTTERRTNKDVVQDAFSALNDRDRDAFIELHSDDVVLHVADEEIQGVDAVVEEEWAHFDAFPDLTLTPDAIHAEDEIVGVRWTAAGTHEGEFKGIEPTMGNVDYSIMGMFRAADGKIEEVWLVADRLALLQQLGIVDPPTE